MAVLFYLENERMIIVKEIPLLTPADVELRVSQIQQTNYGLYVTLLCYKDARCDMNVLDAVFGPMNWKRSHEILNGNLFCTVSLWDEDKQQWISKEDVGVESNTEATKGQASDAFKRACVNVGIGRELYEAPDIRFKLDEAEVTTGPNGKPRVYTKFYVGAMTYSKELGKFTEFTVFDNKGVLRFELKKASQVSVPSPSHTQDQQNLTPASPSFASGSSFCSECNAHITSPKVADFSMKKYGRVLCYKCQKLHNA